MVNWSNLDVAKILYPGECCAVWKINQSTDFRDHQWSLVSYGIWGLKSQNANKYNFNRKRILDRIRQGSIPQQNTTKKYDISNAEINAIRKEGSHPPLVVAFAPSAYAPTLAVNEETKRIKEQYLKQQQLTENVKEDEQKLIHSFKKLMVKQRGKILKVPPGPPRPRGLSIETILLDANTNTKRIGTTIVILVLSPLATCLCLCGNRIEKAKMERRVCSYLRTVVLPFHLPSIE